MKITVDVNSERSGYFDDNFNMILLLMILSTIYGVSGMKGEFNIEAELAQFVVSIWYYHEHRCTGSILSETYILTSGNCVIHLPISSLSVAAGITTLFPRNIQLVPVKTIHFHPEFHGVCLGDGLYWENDIAVVELSGVLRWFTTVAALPMIDAEYNWDPCYKCQVLGWHDATEDGVKLLTLRWYLATVMGDKRCGNLNVTLSKNEKCLLSQVQNVLEDGDYGAPVVCGGLTVGIMVRGGAEEGSPPVLLSIYPYLDFIASILLRMEINVPGRFPYYVALFNNGYFRCGGTIIDSIHIVTAGHCVDGSTRRSLVVLLGRSQFSTDELGADEFGMVDKIQKHPNYQNYRLPNGIVILENDIAVVKLRASLTGNANVKAIGLADYVPVGQFCQAHRWSRSIKKKGKGLVRSLSSPIAIQDPSVCHSINPMRQPDDFCVVNMYSLPITTDGDSGSPLVCDGVIVGVLSSHTLSTRVDWGPFQGSYYTSIYSHSTFIKHVLAGGFF